MDNIGMIKKRLRWKESQIDFLKKYYVVNGPEFCANKLNISLSSVYHKSHRLKLNHRPGWSSIELKILKDNYWNIGASGCTKLINKRIEAIQKMADKLQLNTRKKCGPQKKEIIKHINSNKFIANCIYHGETIFFIRSNKSIRCLKCSILSNNKYRKDNYDKYRLYQRKYSLKYWALPIHNYEKRLRSSLNGLTRRGRNKLSFSKDLSYNSKQLYNHLENIKKDQNNCCPLCCISYNINPFDIDHIIPVSIAKTKEELLKLFNLENLSLLCYKCNRWVKRNKIIRYETK